MRRKFADLANDFEQRLRAISSELATIEGPLEVGAPYLPFKHPTLNYDKLIDIYRNNRSKCGIYKNEPLH